MRPRLASRRPRSLPRIVRARRLRLAGLAETNRAKLDLTLSMVEDDDSEPTASIPEETMADLVFGAKEAA